MKCYSKSFGLVVSSLLVTVLVFMNYTKSLVDQFTFVILLATLTTLVPYAYASAAQIVLAIREPEKFEKLRFARDSTVAALAFAYSVWAIAGSGKDIIAKGFVLLMLGVPVYVYLLWKQQITPAPETPATNTDAPGQLSHAEAMDAAATPMLVTTNGIPS